MTRPYPDRIIVVGAGAAGLMAARELAQSGRSVTILEARDRCGGRIYPLAAEDFGYAAEGGAEFVHGEANVTRGLLHEAGLSLSPIRGTAWAVEEGRFSPRDTEDPHQEEFERALEAVTDDLTLAEFLKLHFADSRYERLRRSVERMVQGYDAADPEAISVLALREEWMDSGRSTQARVSGGYGRLVAFLVAQCRDRGATIRFRALVTVVERMGDGFIVHCNDGSEHSCDAVVLTVPLPLLRDISLPPDQQEHLGAIAHIGFGNVIKLVLRFKTPWWAENPRSLADLTFLISDRRIPVWWTQHPAELPVLTGWFGGPKTIGMSDLGEQELITTGLESLAEIFGSSPPHLAETMIAARAINWAHDPLARGAYSYATPRTRAAQSVLSKPRSGIFLAGEALYQGADMGTVEAALDSGLATARAIVRG